MRFFFPAMLIPKMSYLMHDPLPLGRESMLSEKIEIYAPRFCDQYNKYKN